MQERGAAIAIMVSEGVMMLSQALMSRTSFPLLSTLGKTLPFLLAGGGMALSVRGLSLWLGVGLFTLLLQIATGALLYIGMLLLYARYSRDDDVRQLFRRIGQAVRKAFHRTLPEEKGQAETEPGGFGKS